MKKDFSFKSSSVSVQVRRNTLVVLLIDRICSLKNRGNVGKGILWVLQITWVVKLIWAATRQNQQTGMCAKRRFRSAWASAQSDQSLRCLQEESLGH